MNIQTNHKLTLIKFLIGLTNLFVITNVFAFDTSRIPDRPSGGIGLVSGEVYDFSGRTIDGSGTGTDGLFRCFGKTGVTIRNVTVTGSPRYAFIARGCNDVTIENFNMINNPNSVGGIRFDQGTENRSVRIRNIFANNQGGHAVELWDANGFTVGTIQANNTGKSALLVNRSRNGTINRVEGEGNSPTQGYATLRFANDAGPSVNVGSVRSRNSARGFFTVTRSRDVDLNFVDIASARIQGIFLQDSNNIIVRGGRSRGAQNCLIRGGSGNSIMANCGGR